MEKSCKCNLQKDSEINEKMMIEEDLETTEIKIEGGKIIEEVEKKEAITATYAISLVIMLKNVPKIKVNYCKLGGNNRHR